MIQRVVSSTVLCLALAAAAPPAGAQVGEFLACAAIGDSEERLYCYDKLAERLEQSQPAGDDAGSQWRVASEQSPIDDSTNVYLTRKANDAVEDLLAGTVRPTLWIQCVEGETAAFVDWGFGIGGGNKPFTARLDNQQAETATLQISDDFRSIGSWQSDNVVEYIKRMIDSRQLTVRTTSMSNDPMTVTFDLVGLDQAITPLRQSCGW